MVFNMHFSQLQCEHVVKFKMIQRSGGEMVNLKVETHRDVYILGRGGITRATYAPDSDTTYGYTVLELTNGTYIIVSNLTFGPTVIKF